MRDVKWGMQGCGVLLKNVAAYQRCPLAEVPLCVLECQVVSVTQCSDNVRQV